VSLAVSLALSRRERLEELLEITLLESLGLPPPPDLLDLPRERLELSPGLIFNQSRDRL
jgi:hypothetical protein